MLKWTCISVIGLFLHARILQIVFSQYKMQKTDLTKIGTGIFLCGIFLNVLFRESFFLQIGGQIFLAFGLFFVAWKISESRIRTVRQSFSLVLDEVILQMSSGKSFRDSMTQVCERQVGSLRIFLEDLVLSVVFSQQPKMWSNDLFFQEIVAEFQLIDRSNAKSLDRLRSFRKKIRTQLDFRRKSGQILSQIRTQSMVMSIFYLSLLVYVICSQGFAKNSQLILMSCLFFFLGSFWIYRIGKAYRWKT